MQNRFVKFGLLSILAIIISVYVFHKFKQPGVVRISAFQQGLIGLDPSKEPQIYKQGSNFPYQWNGFCMVAGKKTPCVSHGFEFSFESTEEITEFNCTTKSDRKTTVVAPNPGPDTDNLVNHWSFKVQGHKGHYISSQSIIDVTKSPLTQSTNCTYKDQEAFSYKFTLH